MAIAITASFAKKIPIPQCDYASQQASITITGEVTDSARIPEEATRLFALAEQAVDHQLGITVSATPAASAPVSVTGTVTAASPVAHQRSSLPAPQRTTRAYPTRRKPAISPSQLRLVQRLISTAGASLPGILAEYGVGQLEHLDISQASRLIDALKVSDASGR